MLGLRHRQRVVERGELAAQRAADVAVARAEAVRHVRLDDVEVAGAVEAERLDALTELDGAAGEVLARGHALYRHELAEPLEGGGEVGLVEPRVQAVAVVPALEDVVGKVEADGVVDDGRAAHALALEHLEAGVRGHLHAAVRIERGELLALVFGELGRVDVAAALEHGHFAALLGHPLGKHGAGGARADDDDVRRDAVRVYLAWRADGEWREWALGQIGQRAALLALGERHVSGVLALRGSE